VRLVAFDRKLLHEHEELVLDLRPHWWYMAEPGGAVLGSAVLGLVVLAVLDLDGLPNTILSWLSIALIVGSLVWFGVRYLKWITTNFVVTSDRVVFRVGVLAKRGVEIPLERINTVFFNQTIFERALGAGDVAIESGGETGKETFGDIRKPSAVQNEIYKQMELNNTRMYGGMGGGPGAGTHGSSTSIPAQIAELDQLRQQGVISQAEFETKKAQLLERM
jgi:membrane protein YdbS with pleckstrin-like domain